MSPVLQEVGSTYQKVIIVQNLDSLVASSHVGSGGGVLHYLAVLGLIVLICASLYVLKALWALMQTISEQSTDPHAATPLLLTTGLVVALGGLAYVAYIAQATGTA